MLDFTSASYLGMHHPTRELGPWERLTTGAPAVLDEPAPAVTVARAIAHLEGRADAVLARSTLHAFIDVVTVLGAGGIVLDAGAYPVARWAADAAGGCDVGVHTYAHFDPDALRHRLRTLSSHGRGALVVTDGQCPGCSRVAPLRALVEAARDHGARVAVDDTQAMGVLGRHPTASHPWGVGGGGSIRYHELEGAGVVSISSLAKAFGAPLAAIAGDQGVIDRVARDGPTRTHSSPPSAADVSSAARALVINRREGDARRQALVGVIHRFRRTLHELGLEPRGGCTPIQHVDVAGQSPDLTYSLLHDRGVRAVVTRTECAPSSSLTFVLTVEHTAADIDRLGSVLGGIRAHRRWAQCHGGRVLVPGGRAGPA